MKNKKISIIIVNYRVKKFLFNCIELLYKSSYKNIEIIVVDNDEVKKIKKDLKKKFPKVIYIESSENVGYGRANNIGAIRANGEYLFFINPDTEIHKDALRELITFFEKKKKTGIVAPLLLKKDGSVMEEQGSSLLTPMSAVRGLTFLKNLPILGDKNYRHQKWDKKTIEEVDVVPGTAFMIKRKLFEKIGGFDDDFFLFFEEDQICRKVKELGFKNYIIPSAQVKHHWGESTKQNPKTDQIFKKSRFLYFKKNYGILKAVAVTSFLNFGRNQLFISLILLISLFLNLFNIHDQVRFIGDQAWFYLSARDMLLSGEIPLVGITSSHTWLHQGAFWTYIMAVLFKLSSFNPMSGYYFTAILGTITAYLIYKLGGKMFSVRIGLIGALLYATSPLIIIHNRMSYHTSPIPFFALLLVYSVYKWIQGNILFFPVSIFLLAVLYNFELATFGMSGTFVIIFLFGFFKKKKWAKDVISKKIISLSVLAFLIPMIPMLLYDLSNGFPQTIKFVVWVVYRLAVFLGYPPINPHIGGETWLTFWNYNSLLAQHFVFFPNLLIAFAILILSFMLFIFLMYKKIRTRKNSIPYTLIFMFFTVPFLGFLLQKTNSEAYLLIFFPTAILIIAVFFSSLMRNKLLIYIVSTFLVITAGINSYFLIQSRFITDLGLVDRFNAAKYMIKEANGKPFSVTGTGAGSEHRSFTMNHEFLTWYLGNPASYEKKNIQFVIYEEPYKIDIRRK